MADVAGSDTAAADVAADSDAVDVDAGAATDDDDAAATADDAADSDDVVCVWLQEVYVFAWAAPPLLILPSCVYLLPVLHSLPVSVVSVSVSSVELLRACF